MIQARPKRRDLCGRRGAIDSKTQIRTTKAPALHSRE
jgi:hypothetical protein